MSQRITIVRDGRAVTVILGSWIAKLVGMGHINYGITLSAHTIRFKEHWYGRRHIAHEYGHTLQAEQRGWKYLPWVLWGYVTHGYAKCPAEVQADQYMDAHWQEFEPFGPIPPGISPD